MGYDYMNDMEDILKWMMNPLAIVQKGLEVSDAYQRMLRAQSQMLLAMSEYSDSVANLIKAMTEKGPSARY